MTPTSNPDQASQKVSKEVSQEIILAASSPWVAVVLNLVPGLGTGYIYQRRWRAWWITTGISSAWFLLGALQQPDPAAIDPRSRLVGLGGLLLLAAVSAVEAFLAARRARME
jgi:hypothetical protein